MCYFHKIINSKQIELLFFKKILEIEKLKCMEIIKTYEKIEYEKLDIKIINKYNKYWYSSCILLFKKYGLDKLYINDNEILKKMKNTVKFKKWIKKLIYKLNYLKDKNNILNGVHGKILFLNNNIRKQTTYNSF